MHFIVISSIHSVVYVWLAMNVFYFCVFSSSLLFFYSIFFHLPFSLSRFLSFCSIASDVFLFFILNTLMAHIPPIFYEHIYNIIHQHFRPAIYAFGARETLRKTTTTKMKKHLIFILLFLLHLLRYTIRFIGHHAHLIPHNLIFRCEFIGWTTKENILYNIWYNNHNS